MGRTSRPRWARSKDGCMDAFRLLRPLVLASGSPRRKGFLESMGLKVEVCPASGGEPKPELGEDPAAFTRRCAVFKARLVLAGLAARADSPAILSADTSVVFRDGGRVRILGKPKDDEEAFSMLSLLSGRTHSVVTACCLICNGREEVFHDEAHVTFRCWPPEVLRSYVCSGDCNDKAGAYSIQGKGAFLAREIKGAWSTVVGLPLDMVMSRLLIAKIAAPA